MPTSSVGAAARVVAAEPPGAVGLADEAELLRFSTAGSVDDGKSTLIGRLLYDTKTAFEDQLAHVEDVSRRRGDERVNLALLTDGLRAEREQGITIDVAYRYFATPRRKFIIADTPGHIQYTRNMVTGASTADLALVLVDARKGLVEQSRRHAFLASLLRIPHLVLCVNKMDLVGWDEARFEEPLRFDPRRTTPHLAFGQGIHFCLGSALARLEARVAFEEVFQRWSDWEVDYSHASRARTSSVRGWARLPVKTR